MRWGFHRSSGYQEGSGDTIWKAVGGFGVQQEDGWEVNEAYWRYSQAYKQPVTYKQLQLLWVPKLMVSAAIDAPANSI